MNQKRKEAGEGDANVDAVLAHVRAAGLLAAVEASVEIAAVIGVKF